MKKAILILATFIITGGLIYYNNDINNNDTLDISKQENNEIIKKYGILCYKNDNSIVVLDNNEIFEEINIFDYNIDNIKIGQAIRIDYNNKNELLNIKLITKDEDEYYNVFKNNGIFKDYYKNAFGKMLDLSLDERIGQLFFVRIPEKDKIDVIKNYNIGGYTLYGRDTKNKTKDDLIEMINDFQNNSKIPLLISTDEEGGSVVRISSNPNLRDSPFKSPQKIYSEGGMDAIKENVKEMSNLLYSLGINVNFAPVADISNNKKDFIYNRTIGLDKDGTSMYIENVISESKNYDVSYTMKHFPGYGNNVDTHTGIAIDKRDIEIIKENDLLPFKAGINSKGEAIMISHNIIEKLDNNSPASLSYKVHNLARKDLNFNGILMTDDMDMEAIVKYTSSPYIEAILSGNDMILLSKYKNAYETIKNAIINEELSEDIINHAAFKVLAWKYYKGLIK